jgi:hypothetical protein
VFEEVPDDAQDAVPDGDEGPLLPAAGGHVVELAVEIHVLCMTDGMGGFDECGTKPPVAFAGLAALVLACAFVVAGAHRRPGREVGRGWEAFDVSADFGEEDLGRPASNASDRVQAVDLVLNRAEALTNFLTDLLDQGVEAVQMCQSLSEQEPLVCSELSRQFALQLRALGAQAALRQLGDQTRVSNTTYECFQHLAAGCAEDVVGHIAEFDAGPSSVF